MKIGFVYEYGDEKWSTPGSLMSEFKSRGHDVSRYHLTHSETRLLPYQNLDIIITMDWKGIDIPPSTHDQLDDSIFMIRENADTPQNYQKHLPHLHRYDLLLTPDYTSSEAYKALGHDCVWFNHFADTTIHTQYRGTDTYPRVRSTRGQNGSEFMYHLESVMPNTFINRNGMIGKEYGQFLNNADIVLQNSRWHEITRRIFEGMACCRMVLTDRLPADTHIDDLFIENEDIIYYDGFADCISKINYYLCDEGAAERWRIAKNGYDKVKANHTQVQRADLIIAKYNEWKTKK
jgi:hypothetical protein